MNYEWWVLPLLFACLLTNIQVIINAYKIRKLEDTA